MENFYGFHCYSEHQAAPIPLPPPIETPPSSELLSIKPNFLRCQQQEEQIILDEVSNNKVLKAKVASHPLFPHLLHAYIHFQKVAAVTAEAAETAKMAEQLDDSIGILSRIPNLSSSSSSSTGDPELDHFMETYCNLLGKLKDNISRPFEEAKAFLNAMETQFNSIVISNNNVPPPSSSYSSSSSAHHHHASSHSNIHPLIDNEVITGSSEKCLHKENYDQKETNIINHQELKDDLLRRYSGYITNLKHEFSKNKKKERLPNEAKQILLAWWNIHFKWPYPTDADKVALAEWTGLDTKQINNWFINQRKRHWKPTEEEMETTVVLDGIYGPICITEK